MHCLQCEINTRYFHCENAHQKKSYCFRNNNEVMIFFVVLLFLFPKKVCYHYWWQGWQILVTDVKFKAI